MVLLHLHRYNILSWIKSLSVDYFLKYSEIIFIMLFSHRTSMEGTGYKDGTAILQALLKTSQQGQTMWVCWILSYVVETYLFVYLEMSRCGLDIFVLSIDVLRIVFVVFSGFWGEVPFTTFNCMDTSLLKKQCLIFSCKQNFSRQWRAVQ